MKCGIVLISWISQYFSSITTLYDTNYNRTQPGSDWSYKHGPEPVHFLVKSLVPRGPVNTSEVLK